MKSKNKFIIIALVCLITISSVWAGRTFAYFNASSNASGTITMGTLKVNDFGELDAETSLKVVPNQTVTKNFKATIESDIKYYKRLSLSATVEVATGKSHDSTCGDYVADDTSILNATVQGFEKYTADDGSIYYYSLAPVTPNNSNLTDENFTVNLSIHDWVGKGGCDYYMGATIKIGVKVEVIQADYLEDNGLANLNTFTTATALHDVWANCCSTDEDDSAEDVQDVSAYPDLEFSVLSEEEKTMSVKAANTDISEANIPAQVMSEGEIYDVSNIRSLAFYMCSNLTSVNIPNSTTSIGNYAFYNCSNLSTIEIPDGVRSIGDSVFYNCSSLTTVIIPNSVTSMGNYVFQNCSSLIYNTYDNGYYLGNNLNSYIALISAISTGVTKCEINANCKFICSMAFANCKKLTSITIPDKIIDIGAVSFGSCYELTTINVDENNGMYKSVDGVVFSKDDKTLICCPAGKRGDYTITNNVTTIGQYAFQGSSLTSITISSSMAKIGSLAFMGFSGDNITFNNTSGWHLDSATGDSIDVTNPSINATNLASGTWYNYALYRVDE